MSVTAIVPISLPRELARALDRAARQDAMTRSEFVRNLIRRRLAISDLRAFQKEVAPRARAVGLRSLNDAVSAVRAVRSRRR